MNRRKFLLGSAALVVAGPSLKVAEAVTAEAFSMYSSTHEWRAVLLGYQIVREQMNKTLYEGFVFVPNCWSYVDAANDAS